MPAPIQARMAPQNGFCIPVQQPSVISNMPHYSQQDADQLSETSGFILLATQPPETLTYPTAPTYIIRNTVYINNDIQLHLSNQSQCTYRIE